MHVIHHKPRRKDAHVPAVKLPLARGEKAGMRLPHEHDESHDSQGGGPHAIMHQAKDDVENGIVDTDRRSAYGLSDGEGLCRQPRKR